MSTGRFVAPGKTRSCPHCRATILDSATVCPGCHHHLKFGSAGQRPQEVVTPLRVEGTLRHPPDGGAWEYSVVLSIRSDRGEEIARQIVGVGALNPAEARTFALAVEVFKPAEIKEPKPEASSGRGAGAPGSAGSAFRPGSPSSPGSPARPASPVRPGPSAGGPGSPGAGTGLPGGRPEPSRPGLTAGQGTAGSGAAPLRPEAPGSRPAVGTSPPQGSGLRPRPGSVFKDPRVPLGSPGLQPKR